MSDHRRDAPPRFHEDERIKISKDLRLVQAWQEQNLPIFIPLKPKAGVEEWIPVTIKKILRDSSNPTAKGSLFAVLTFGSPETSEPIEQSIPLSELIALQDQRFLDQASELIGKIIQNSHDWISPKDAANDLTGSDYYSVHETSAPPTESEIQQQVDTIITDYRKDIFARNKAFRGMPSYLDEVPLLIRTMNSWSQGRASPGKMGLELRKSAFAHWRDEDFRKACERIELALEESHISTLLQEILLYGIEAKKLPPAVSSETYGEFLLYLQHTAGKRRMPESDHEVDGTEPSDLLDLQKRLSLVESWRMQHAPIHLKLGANDLTWIEGDWIEGVDLKNDPTNEFEKGVPIAFEAPATETQTSNKYRKLIRLSQLIRFQEDYFLEQARKEIRHLQEPHHWLTETARESIDVSGETYSVETSDAPPTEKEKREALSEAALAYRNHVFSRNGLIKRAHPPGTRSLRPIGFSVPRPSRSSYPPGATSPEPEIIHHWNAWSAGIRASEGPYKNYREVIQPEWSDADYAELCKRIQREIWAVDASAALQKIQRFGVSSVELPHTTSPKALLQVLKDLENLATFAR